MDGALARAQGHDSAAGDVLDHVLDRYADILIIAGLAAGIKAYALGFLAVTGVLMTSYLGTQTQAVGLDRVYAGVLGRADRLALATVTAVLAAITGPIIVWSSARCAGPRRRRRPPSKSKALSWRCVMTVRGSGRKSNPRSPPRRRRNTLPPVPVAPLRVRALEEPVPVAAPPNGAGTCSMRWRNSG